MVLRIRRNSWNASASASLIVEWNSNGYGFKWFSIVKVTL
jgi:hypothetical protein